MQPFIMKIGLQFPHVGQQHTHLVTEQPVHCPCTQEVTSMCTPNSTCKTAQQLYSELLLQSCPLACCVRSALLHVGLRQQCLQLSSHCCHSCLQASKCLQLLVLLLQPLILLLQPVLKGGDSGPQLPNLLLKLVIQTYGVIGSNPSHTAQRTLRVPLIIRGELVVKQCCP